MGNVTRLMLIGTLLIGALGPARRVSAFERSAVTDDPGTALFWRYRTVRVYPLYDSSGDIIDVQVAGALARSLDAWSYAAEGCGELLLVDAGWATGGQTNLDGGEHDGENRIRWREDVWPADMGIETLALTTLVYRRTSGEILDADIDLNGVDHQWSVLEPSPPGSVDVENTLTHELGHLIGLAHVADPDATMYERSAPGELDKRSLSQDEVDAICTVYPPRALSPGAPLFHSTGLTGGCAVRSPGSPTPGLLSVFALSLLCCRARGRRSRRRRAARRAADPLGRACASR